jgi:hypothetical protein
MLSADPDIRRLMALRAVAGGLLRLKWLAAATCFEITLRRHDRALKAGFNPDEPRDDRGRWTDGGDGAGNNVPGILSDASPDPLRPGAQYAQEEERDGAGSVMINGEAVEATPAQAARLAVAEAQTQEAIRRVHALDPNWEPTPSLYSTVEGYIAANQDDAAQARDRLEQLRSVGIGPGPFAGESIPAGDSVTAADRRELNRIGSETGCNTCGTFDPGTLSGNFVADHQPPTGLNFSGAAQRLYPQCIICSARQGGWVRQLKR